jgi:hypothetical protein
MVMDFSAVNLQVYVAGFAAFPQYAPVQPPHGNVCRAWYLFPSFRALFRLPEQAREHRDTP